MATSDSCGEVLCFNDGLHFRQPWVMGVQPEIERLKQWFHKQKKLLREPKLRCCFSVCLNLRESAERKPVDPVDGEGAVPEPEERPNGVKAAKAAKKRKKTGKEEELAKLENLLEIKKQISKKSLLESLLAKPEPLSEMESALKMKLMSDLL
ncbi:hypothetical protein YC2023_083148 [Brassica napus]